MEVATGNVVAIANLVRDPETGQCSESYNHALGSAVEPGSTFKLASLMAMLETGRIAPGLSADFLVLEGDPLEDLAALDDPEWVVIRGQWLDRDARRVLASA